MKRWGSALKLWQPVSRRWGRPGLLLVTVLTVLLLAGGGVLALLRLNTPGGGALGWYNAAWPYRIKLTIKHSNVDESLSDFPVYVDMADLPGNFFSHVQSSGGDIRVTAADGTTEVAREVAAISTSGKTGELYFKAPALSPTADNSFYIYYGNPGASSYTATDAYGTHNVWTNGYAQVYHLGDDPSGAAPQIVDSTGNGGDGTANGTMVAGDVVAGKVGDAINFDGVDDYISLGGTIPTGPSTFSVWEKSSSSVKMGMVGKLSYWTDSYGYGMYMENNAIKALAFNAYSGVGPLATPAVDGNWHSGTFTLDNWGAGTTGKLYLDGSLSASGSGPAAYYSSYQYTIGSGHTSKYFFSGTLDEVRVSSVERSAGWIATAYHNQNSPTTFYTLDAQPLQVATGEKGLVGWWKLDGNAKDSTPYGHDGSVTGATLAADRHGSANHAYSFDGTDSITIPNPLNQAAADEEWTVNAWVKLSASGPSASQYLVSGMNLGLYANFSNSDKSLLYLNAGTNDYYEYGTRNLRDDNWHMLTYVFRNSDGYKKIYVDGMDDSSSGPNKTSTPSGLASDLQIGKSLVGAIADLRIYNRVLSDDDITNLYGNSGSQLNLYRPAGSQPSISLTAGLVGHWPFNGNAKDVTPYGNNGTVNGASLTTDRNGRQNSAYSFDGTGSQTISIPDSSVTRQDGPFSISFWYQDNGSTNTFPVPIYKGCGCSAGDGWLIFFSASSGKLAYKRNPTQLTLTTSDIGAGQPTLITATYDGSTLTWYYNGAFSNSTNVTFPATTGTASLIIGGQNTSSAVKGSVDDLRLWNRALSAGEVAALYQLYE